MGWSYANTGETDLMVSLDGLNVYTVTSAGVASTSPIFALSGSGNLNLPGNLSLPALDLPPVMQMMQQRPPVVWLSSALSERFGRANQDLIMKHVKVPLPVMQEIVNVLARMPYNTVGGLMPKIEQLSVEDDAPVPADRR